eukprot:6202347-Pleurochrysis_carterae.AAC.7
MGELLHDEVAARVPFSRRALPGSSTLSHDRLMLASMVSVPQKAESTVELLPFGLCTCCFALFDRRGDRPDGLPSAIACNAMRDTYKRTGVG